MRIVLGLVVFGLLTASCSREKVVKVGLQPFGNFSQALCDTVATTIERTYGVTVFKLKAKPIPTEAFINIKTPRYRADQLIKILKTEKPDFLRYLIGLTLEDISTTKRNEFGMVKEPKSKYEDWGIFGFGYVPGPSCIVSTYRLGDTQRAKFIERVKKVSLHELGHNFGLDHCESEYCVMRDAVETIKTIDSVKPDLCERCKRNLQ